MPGPSISGYAAGQVFQGGGKKKNRKPLASKKPPGVQLSGMGLGVAPERPKTISGGLTGSQVDNSTQPPPVTTPPAPTPPAPSPTPTTLEQGLNYSSYNPTSGQPDPRDSTYWANLTKLRMQTSTDYASGLLEQQQANANFDYENFQRKEGDRRNTRNIAESLIGTGLLRSGAHNRSQTERLADFADLQGNADLNKYSSDQSRTAQLKALVAMLPASEQGLYAEAVGRYSDAQQKQAESGEGINKPGDTNMGKPNKDKNTKPGKNKTKGGKPLTDKIHNVRGKIKQANDPKVRAKLERKLERLRKERNRRQRKQQA